MFSDSKIKRLIPSRSDGTTVIQEVGISSNSRYLSITLKSEPNILASAFLA